MANSEFHAKVLHSVKHLFIHQLVTGKNIPMLLQPAHSPELSLCDLAVNVNCHKFLIGNQLCEKSRSVQFMKHFQLLHIQSCFSCRQLVIHMY